MVLGVRKHGETSVIAELMTLEKGRHLGLVQGGRSRTMRPVLQPGNSVKATWRARLEDHLGQFRIEGETLRAAQLMDIRHGLYALQTLSSHLRLLPERDAHPALYRSLIVVLDHLQDPFIGTELLVRFEMAVLEELGFGIDLSCCAATGTTENLLYVSPKSGRAVSEEAGEPYRDKLLALPSFLRNRHSAPIAMASLDDLTDGMALTAHFLDRHVMVPRGLTMPPERAAFLRSIKKQAEGANDGDD